MITTTTFLIELCAVGVGVGVGVAEGELDAPFTPPHPVISARDNKAKKNENARLKGAAPLSVFESALFSLVGSEFQGFLTNLSSQELRLAAHRQPATPMRL
jgi:hypothetical protein